MNTEEGKNHFLQTLRNVFAKDQAKERALKYLNEWGENFWEQTEFRIKEFTTKLETELQGTVSAEINPLQLGAAGAKRLSEEQRTETVARAREVVNKVQLRELHQVIKLLAEDVFVDAQQKYYLVIDRLDEDWVDDQIRYKLIKALIEAVKSFRAVQGLKIVVALRSDLLQRVLEETRNVGFQEEKYLSLFMPITWTKDDLRCLANTRVNYLFRNRYTSKSVGLDDILANIQIDRTDAFGYIIDRSLLRPRDVISFLNHAIQQADGKAHISRRELTQAEEAYSRERLKALLDEWRVDYPGLEHYVRVIRGKTTRFRLGLIDDEEVSSIMEEIMMNGGKKCQVDPIFCLSNSYLNDGGVVLRTVWEKLVRILFQVGLVGLKPNPQESWKWSYIHGDSLQECGFNGDTQCAVHKAFHRVLSIRPQD